MDEQLNPTVHSLMKQSIEHGRLAHAYLFEGEKGTGKHQESLWLAKRLYCTNVKDNEPCHACINCLRIENNEHPNVHQVTPDGQTIKVDQIRQLQTEFAKRGFEAGRQIFILSDAETMNVQAANSLLKFLEEPSGQVLLLLETSAIGKILPTIQSRCQIIHFHLSTTHLIEQLQQAGLSLNTAKILAFLTNSYDKAVEISRDEWFNDARDVLKQFVQYLTNRDFAAFVYVQRKIIPITKEKQQQQLFFDLLMYAFRTLRDENQGSLQTVYNQALADLLQAKMKLNSNVAFQNVIEQFVLHFLQQ